MTERIPESVAPQTLEEDDDIPSNPNTDVTIGDIIDARYGRRGVLKGMTAVGAVAAAAPLIGGFSKDAQAAGASSLTFPEVAQVYDETHHVAEGYNAGVLIRWGDKVEADAPEFDINNLTADAQAKQFGYNNDYVGFVSLPRGSNSSTRGLLCVNHEYTNRELMWTGMGGKDAMDLMTEEQANVEIAAHGHTILEIVKEGEAWAIVEDSKYNRRISAGLTEMTISGPAAGHDRLKTSADPTGTTVIGTVNNCAGGRTPWGTVLIAEENFHGYFGGDPTGTAEEVNYKRYGLGKPRYPWYKFHDRFDVTKELNEPNRFGWMVEIDPYDPDAKPIKRTALGRFKHEGANTIINHDGRLAVYTGDDQRFDYVYKFISRDVVNMDDPAANKDLLDHGTLSVGRFDADGSLVWMPLVHGEGPLTAENGFNSQADVMIETRRAADLLGATPMDRPEDVEPNPVSGTVYMMLTNNTKRTEEQVDAANPRANNEDGHIMEMIPPGDGTAANAVHEADTFKWEIFIRAGNPAEYADTMYNPGTTENGWFSSPDNVAFDKDGHIWISTDGSPKKGIADGLWGADVDGDGRALTRRFYACPSGAELCGPEFTPDSETLFLAIQHPGDDKGSTFDEPSTRWPDFADGMPPRPSIVFVTKKGGGQIG